MAELLQRVARIVTKYFALLLMASVVILLPLLDHYLGQLFGKNSGWYALGAVLTSLLYAVGGWCPALCGKCRHAASGNPPGSHRCFANHYSMSRSARNSMD
jgi:hypothetical protein